jgi:hypothetical protein
MDVSNFSASSFFWILAKPALGLTKVVFRFSQHVAWLLDPLSCRRRMMTSCGFDAMLVTRKESSQANKITFF